MAELSKPLQERSASSMKKLRDARLAAYGSLFLTNGAYGVYGVTYAFFLERIGGYTNADAATISSLAWLGYSLAMVVGNPIFGALADRVGKKKVLLLSLAWVGVAMAALSWAKGAWWIAEQTVAGFVDNTFFIPYAILVECVAHGAPPGESNDYFVLKVGRRIFRPKRGDFKSELAAAFSIAIVVGGCGLMVGLAVGYLVEYVGAIAFSFAVAGGFYFLAFLVVYVIYKEEDFLSGEDVVVGDFAGGNERRRSRDEAADSPPNTDDTPPRSIFSQVRASVVAQAKTLDLLFHRDLTAVSVAAAMWLGVFVLVGNNELGIFWGQKSQEWGTFAGYLFFVTFSVAVAFSFVFCANAVPRIGYAPALVSIAAVSTLASLFVAGLTYAGRVTLTLGPTLGLIFAAMLIGGNQPTIDGLLSSRVPLEEQGQLQGALSALTTLAAAVALGVYLIFFQELGPTSIWLVSAGASALAAPASYYGTRHIPTPEDDDDDVRFPQDDDKGQPAPTVLPQDNSLLWRATTDANARDKKKMPATHHTTNRSDAARAAALL